MESRRQMSPPGRRPSFDLPKALKTYLRSPRQSFRKIAQWLNACWRLRSCNHVGRWTRLVGRPFITNRGEMVIGDHVQVFSHYARSVFAVFPGGRLEIGDRTFLNYGMDIAATRLVKIGADCLIGTHVIILDNDFHQVSNHARSPAPKPVIIGDRVWVGNRVTILPGVSIGDDSVVGAGSVVVRDIPARSVAVGNPARVVHSL